MTQDPGDRAANAFFGEPGWRTGGTLPKPLCEVVSFSAGVLRGADLSRVKRDTRCATCRVGFLGWRGWGRWLGFGIMFFLFNFSMWGSWNGKCAFVQSVKTRVIGHEETVAGVHVGLAP